MQTRENQGLFGKELTLFSDDISYAVSLRAVKIQGHLMKDSGELSLIHRPSLTSRTVLPTEKKVYLKNYVP